MMRKASESKAYRLFPPSGESPTPKGKLQKPPGPQIPRSPSVSGSPGRNKVAPIPRSPSFSGSPGQHKFRYASRHLGSAIAWRSRKSSVTELRPMSTVQEQPMDSPTVPVRMRLDFEAQDADSEDCGHSDDEAKAADFTPPVSPKNIIIQESSPVSPMHTVGARDSVAISRYATAWHDSSSDESLPPPPPPPPKSPGIVKARKSAIEANARRVTLTPSKPTKIDRPRPSVRDSISKPVPRLPLSTAQQARRRSQQGSSDERPPPAPLKDGNIAKPEAEPVPTLDGEKTPTLHMTTPKPAEPRKSHGTLHRRQESDDRRGRERRVSLIPADNVDHLRTLILEKGATPELPKRAARTDRLDQIDPTMTLVNLTRQTEALHVRYATLRFDRQKLTTSIQNSLKERAEPETLLDLHLSLAAVSSSMDICFAKLHSLECQKDEAMRAVIRQCTARAQSREHMRKGIKTSDPFRSSKRHSRQTDRRMSRRMRGESPPPLVTRPTVPRRDSSTLESPDEDVAAAAVAAVAAVASVVPEPESVPDQDVPFCASPTLPTFSTPFRNAAARWGPPGPAPTAPLPPPPRKGTDDSQTSLRTCSSPARSASTAASTAPSLGSPVEEKPSLP
ncbi:hypothetical protein K470DRAFT_262801 [Piedraia hortae CBS 480.64]|uniref:Uncharacterized protein n=1 Tax=Piedraia hortae CBS 480.64 TaxID=1314780 RepID=A0A6A7C7D5_9PEZI|nr:hypothetical protein K470DRAFT_262801 [Piedraia hortae CBS 480.64]